MDEKKVQDGLYTKLICFKDQDQGQMENYICMGKVSIDMVGR